MRKIFSFDSPIFLLLSAIADLMIISVLWTVFSIPIFTIGASTTSMYRVMLNIADDKGGSVFSQYYRAFLDNFTIGTKTFAVLIPAFILIVLDICLLFSPYISKFSAMICIISLVFIGAIIGYVFPLTAQFDNTVKNTIKNAFLIAISKPFMSLIIVSLNSLPIIVFAFFPYAFIYTLIFWPIIGIGIIARVNTCILRKFFNQLIENQSEK